MMTSHSTTPSGADRPSERELDSTVALLLDACKQGDQRAWSKLIGLYGGLVYGVARKHGLAEHACDDIAQVVFASLLRSLASIREPAALPGWLTMTTRRACWRLVQRQRTQQQREGAATGNEHEADNVLLAAGDTPEASTLLATIERAHAVRLALDELGGRCRELLRALFLETAKPDYTAIGHRLDMPVGSIGPTRNRCLAKLAELLPATHKPD
jgi:RNA polymerase sigma factor (sigma-70 family)